MRDWEATHDITHDGKTVKVMLEEGQGYTEEQWYTFGKAEYKREDDGSWLFQGEAFSGVVQAIPVGWQWIANYLDPNRQIPAEESPESAMVTLRDNMISEGGDPDLITEGAVKTYLEWLLDQL